MVELLSSSAEYRVDFGGRPIRQCLSRFSPNSVIVASQGADRPIAAEQQALRAEALKREVDVGFKLGGVPIWRGSCIQPGDLGVDIGSCSRDLDLFCPW